MPTLEVSKKDFEKLLGEKVSIPKLEELLEFVKGELDGVQDDVLKVDCKETNRPDLWSTEGLAREIRAKIGKEKGVKKYVVEKGDVEVFIDKNLEKIRPFIVCAVVKNVKIDNDFIIQMVQLQEKVGDTFGRKRKETGIGLYDLDIMKPPIYYKGFKDDEIEFIPLEWKVPMRPSEILSQHDKGKAYKHLLDGVKLYPIVIDSNDVVASMPPIINSQLTGKVTEKTKNLFIEVTGFDLNVVETALEVMCMALADRGGKICSCKINFPKGSIYPKKSIYTPEFKTKKLVFKKDIVEIKTGLKLKDSEIKNLLERARFNTQIKGEKIIVEYSDYRKDILHPVDVIEDLLISYGYNNINPSKIEMVVVGSQRKEVVYNELIRDACIGLNLQEVITFNLTSKELQLEKVLIEEDLVELDNPVSTKYCVMRKNLFPQLLSFISKNKSCEFPQKIFEIGTCLELDSEEKDGFRQSTKLSVLLTHTNINFTEIKSVLVSLCDYLGLDLKLKKSSFSFLGENSAEIIVNGKKGFVGELNKEVEQNFGLKKPVALFEFEL
jgi:phenylalanyl-tRNA synthetase beta chain